MRTVVDGSPQYASQFRNAALGQGPLGVKDQTCPGRLRDGTALHTAATLPDSFALPPGMFFDAASLHLLASGTLAPLRMLASEDAQLGPRRFRPNIVVDPAPGVEGFLDDGWLDGALEVGERARSVVII
jgi:uncharacterized protein YcbX